MTDDASAASPVNDAVSAPASEAATGQADGQSVAVVDSSNAPNALGNWLSDDAEPSTQTQGEEAATETTAQDYDDFTLPEGFAIEETDLKNYKSLAKELGLSQEAAQKLIDYEAGRIKQAAEQPFKLWEQTQNDWRQQVANDPTIGGKDLQKNLAVAKLAINTLDAGLAKEFRQALEFTGAGNHPAVIKALHSFGTKFQEPGFVRGNPNTQQAKSPADLLYPTINNS